MKLRTSLKVNWRNCEERIEHIGKRNATGNVNWGAPHTAPAFLL